MLAFCLKPSCLQSSSGWTQARFGWSDRHGYRLCFGCWKLASPVCGARVSLPDPSASQGEASSATTSADPNPPKPKKPRGLELPSSPSLSTVLSLDKVCRARSQNACVVMTDQSLRGASCVQVNAAVNSLLAPGSAANTLTPSVITPHALVSVCPLCHNQRIQDLPLSALWRPSCNLVNLEIFNPQRGGSGWVFYLP